MEFEREELCGESALALSVGKASSCVREVERGDSRTSGDSGAAPGINECNKEHACVRARGNASMHTHTHTHMHTRTLAHMHTCTHAHIHTRTHVINKKDD